MEVIRFDRIKSRLMRELIGRSERDVLNIDEKWTLIDGFLNPSTPEKLTSSFLLGGTTLPMIMLIGNKSGRVYPFALRALIPNLDDYADRPNECPECKELYVQIVVPGEAKSEALGGRYER